MHKLFQYFSAKYYLGNGLSQENGATITLAERDQDPNFSTDFINLEPGTATNIGLSLQNTTRMPGPYKTNCRHDYPNSWAKTSYNVYRCATYCWLSSLRDVCNCTFAHFFPGTGNRTYYDGLKFCPEAVHTSCWMEHSRLNTKGWNLCDICTPECNAAKYIVRAQYFYRLHKIINNLFYQECTETFIIHR